MGLLKINPRDIEQILMFYQSKTFKELQLIRPNWAYDINIKKAWYDFSEDYSTFLVKPEELISNAEMNEVTTNFLFTGNSMNDTRIARILYRWENNEFVDPPRIDLSNGNSNKVSFSDGRHRSKLAYFLEYDYIPILIHKLDIDSIGKILKLRMP